MEHFGGADSDLLEKGLPKTSVFLPPYLKHLKEYKDNPYDNNSCITLRHKADNYIYNLKNNPFNTDIATIKKEPYSKFTKYIFSPEINEKFTYRSYKENYGLEIRFFDWMTLEHLKNILIFIIYLGELSFSTTHKIIKVNDNEDWNKSVIDVFNNGYKTKLNNNYINLIEDNLKIKLGNSKTPGTIINKLSKYLSDNYNDKKFSKVMCSKNYKKIKIFNMNKEFLNYYN